MKKTLTFVLARRTSFTVAAICALLLGIAAPMARASAATAQAAAASAGAQKLLPAQSTLVFISRQMGVPVQGKFTRFEVVSQFDPKKLASSKVSLTIDLLSADLGNAETETELKKPGWFDSVKRPQATFVSTSIRALGGNRFEVDGQLAIKGNKQRLLVPVTLVQKDGLTTVEGALQLKRADYKIGDGEWSDASIVANEVEVKFKLVLTGLPLV